MTDFINPWNQRCHNRHLRIAWIVVLSIGMFLVLSGCSSSPSSQAAASASSGVCGESLSAEQGVKLSLIRQQLRQAQYYSALAELEMLPERSLSTDLLRAYSYRKLGKWSLAAEIYHDLQTTCLAGQAYHGLGLIAAYQDDLDQAMHWLSLAAKASPITADIRNDLGFLLLITGQDALARDELLTALELNPEHQNAAKNLWFVLLKNQQYRMAEQLASRFQWQSGERQEVLNAIAVFRPLSLGQSPVQGQLPEPMSARSSTMEVVQ
ncbi:hypothetical protein [Photobacterium sp. TY1-4]|uniref:hypothetical protein n=1 Tax=Photobacterium sp. TY1-4 TaxID=2899122 RepID=UPI0021C18B28|nr:hypothetical protein [Photobacterium sp. TY1-4]UXI02192.1 hypothetical protein NH461_05275 [Photobacterium sp. TY1-4]